MRTAARPVAIHRLRPSALALAIASVFAWAPISGQANPTGGVAIHGGASVTQPAPNQLLVTTTNGAGTRHSVINWQSFSIPSGSGTHIAQPTSGSLSINRVVAAQPSLIYGTLSSNGQVLLVNPAGITVGAGAVVDTAGFIASTLPLSEADAIAARLRFGDGSGGGDLLVQGRVLAREGDVVLLAPQVTVAQDAIIRSPNGTVVLAAGQQVEITGRGIEGIHLQVQAPTDSAVNLGSLQGDAVAMFAGTLRHSGLIQANAVSTEGGRVVLKASERADVGGTVLARALDGSGGSIHATARQVVVTADAVLDARASSGAGGEILVGGGWQGGDARVSNAETTVVATGAQLLADAAGTGDGGTVVVWSDGSTRYGGHISARGGAMGGNGGVAEVSGKQWLDFRGTVDLTAAQGAKGQLLLDPQNIEIVADADADTPVTGDILASDPPASGTSKISANLVSGLVQSADLTLAATDWIDLKANVDTDGVGNNWLNLDAGIGIRLDASVVSGNSLNLELRAGTGGVTQLSGTLDVDQLRVISGGNVALNQTGNRVLSLSGSTTGGADMELTVSGQAISLGGLNLSGDFTLVTNDEDVSQSAAVTVDGVTTINAGAGLITLSNAANDFNVFGATSGGMDLRDSNALALNQINAGDDLSIEAGGALTRNAGTVQSDGLIALAADSIGSSSNYLALESSGSVELTLNSASGAIHVSEESGLLNTGDYQINTDAGSGQVVKLAADAVTFGGFDVTSLGLTNDAITLSARTGNLTVQSGLTLTAGQLDLRGESVNSNVTLGDTAGAITLNTTNGVKVYTGGGDLDQVEAVTLTGGLILTVGGDVLLNNAGNSLGAVTGTVSGDATLTGLSGIGANGLRATGQIDLSGTSISIGGALRSTTGDITASATTNLAVSAAGSVSASQITFTGNAIIINGQMYPGRNGVAGGLLTLNGATTFGRTSQLHIDFDGTTHDSVTVTTSANFQPDSRLFANAVSQPPVGSYTVLTGDTLGTVPTIAGTVTNASLSVGSLVVTVSPPPAVPVDTQTVVDQIIQDFTTLFEQEVGEGDQDDLPETVIDPVQRLALAEDDIVVDDVSCRPR